MKNLLFLFISYFFFTSTFAQTAKALYNEGLSNVKNVNRVEAQENFNQAISKNPNYSDAYYQRGLLLRHFHKIGEAKADFNKVVNLNKTFIKEAQIELGEIYFDEKKYEEALKNYSSVIEKDSSYQEAYLHRGKCYYFSKQFKKSTADLNKSNELKANDEAYFYLGLNSIEEENWNIAEKHFDSAIELNDKDGEYFLYRGSAYFSQADDPTDHHHHDRLKSAISDYDKALELDSKLEEAYFERGEVKMELGDYKGAIADFQKAIKITPSDLDAHYQKAICNYHYGYEKQAKSELEDILKKDPDFIDAIYQLGKIELEDEDNLQKALEYFDKLVKLGSEDPNVFLFRAYARLDLGDKSGSCEDFHKADELGDKEAHQKIHKYCK